MISGSIFNFSITENWAINIIKYNTYIDSLLIFQMKIFCLDWDLNTKSLALSTSMLDILDARTEAVVLSLSTD
jgi:hypothetical protein